MKGIKNVFKVRLREQASSLATKNGGKSGGGGGGDGKETDKSKA